MSSEGGHLAVLCRVGENTAAFDGGSGPVTVAGQEATGGRAVECLSGMPAAEGLFRGGPRRGRHGARSGSGSAVPGPPGAPPGGSRNGSARIRAPPPWRTSSPPTGNAFSGDPDPGRP
ncbi:hypothetical protein AB0O01_01610 [Streptomyces sp. NPDC093252]|uniref:hypothetical protein n=1 Tax=Streptomyces sp. NPDC093252 TaxID=3154980 RepID=UPI00341315F1